MYSHKIEGWFYFPQVYCDFVLHELPNNAEVVEVGCWLGKSTIFMAEVAKSIGKKVTIYAVDTWKGSDEEYHQKYIESIGGAEKLYEQFLNNVQSAGVSNIIWPIRKSSLEAVKRFKDESLDLVFIDASHKYEDVKNDIIAWYPKVKIGGIIAGDDISWPDVNKAIYEVLGKKIQGKETAWIYKK